MKKQNKTIISILLIGFMVFAIIPSFLLVPSTIQTTLNFDTGNTQEPEPKTSQFIPRTIRVAILNDLNTTRPKYADPGGHFLVSNYTGLLQLLQGAGYQVDELTHDDIYNHKLLTADYDVFIMADNLPKRNITYYVKEFWLGGGGLLSFDSAISYLCYFGILIPESAGDEGRGTYYEFAGEISNNISSRHPTTQDYQVGDKFSNIFTAPYLYWDVLLTTSVGSMVTKLANADGTNNWATAIALERTDQGGRVVQLPGRTNVIGTNMSNLILEAVDWLCPRPKGRILFDLSHEPFYGIDDWDKDYADFGPRYYFWRDGLVNRSYTVDKLYPSAAGNLTSSNLAPYDMLVLCNPSINYTANEISDVMNWVNNGGGLFILGGYYSGHSQRINDLLASTGLKINYTLSGSTGIADYVVEHPTVEGCTELNFPVSPSFINYSGDAFPIWGKHSKDIVIGGQEYGNGCIILSGDMFFLRYNNIDLEENEQFGINVANWLTSSQANVLLFTNAPTSANYYVNPVARALNDLKIPFALTFDYNYLNLSMYKYNWELVIVDQPYYPMDFDIFIDYIDAGGRLLMSTFMVDDIPSHPLWAKLGFSYNNTVPIYSYTPIFKWDLSHRIFTFPALYSANNFTPFDSYGDEGDYLNVYPNATALAGFYDTIGAGNASIVLRNDGKTLFNAYLIDQFNGDLDDSTYTDNFELWINEIAYMTYQSLSVQIITPHAGDVFNATAPSFSITTDGIIIDETYYTLNDGTHRPVSSTTGTIHQGNWDALPDGPVSLKFYVEDTAGSSKYHERIIDKDTQAPIIDIISPTSGQIINTTTAPSFIVNITDDHLDKMWYTVDVGLTNFTFTANGTINQAAWDNITEGTVAIRFYANDTLGHESSKQVSIVFELPPASRRKIPGFDTYLIIGVISVISVLILETRLKRLRLKN